MSHHTLRSLHQRFHLGFLGGCLFLVLAFVIWVPDAEGFDRWQDGCNDAACHGHFNDDTTTKGSIFPAGDSGGKHFMHRESDDMGTDCAMCHSNGDQKNPYIGASSKDGNGLDDGPGCTGCHNGTGLRLHHEVNGQDFCFECHSRTPPAPNENVNPVYYGTPGTNADDSCNATASARTGENWTLNDFEGLDNDGDNFYDTADSDCSVMPAGAGESGQLMLTLEANGDLTLSWSDSCNLADTDYGVYEGVLAAIPPVATPLPDPVDRPVRDFSTHQFVQCSTGGGTAATFTPGADLRYYLVVPSNGTSEGSYETDRPAPAGPTQRGQGVSSCETQTVAACS
jgi:hypothetical protein